MQILGYPDIVQCLYRQRAASLQGANETAILVVAPDAPDQLLSSILSTAQLAQTPLGPCRITWAHSLDEGLALLTAHPYEACLVDSGLGAGSIAFLREARTRGWRRPLILCTSVGQQDMQATAQAAGASDVLAKTSVSLSTLGRVIQAAIQRSRFDETLRFGEEMVRILVEGTRDYAIYMLDREGRILTWNQGAERMTGYRSIDVIGHHVSMLYPEAERQDLKPAASLRHAVAHGRFEEEGLRVRKAGSSFWVHSVMTPLYGEDGKLRGFSKVSRDITAHKDAEIAQRRDNARFSEAFRASPIGSSITALADGLVLDVNAAFCRTFGYSRDELVGRHISEFPGLWPMHEGQTALAQLLRTDGSYKDIEMAVSDREGRPRRVRVSASKVDMDGQPCVVTATEDITTAHFFQEQAGRREARLREAEHIAGMASWEWDIQARTVHWSPNMYVLLGLDPNVARPRLRTYLDLVHPEDRPGVEAAMRAVRDAPATFEHEHRILRPDGSMRWMRARGALAGPARRMVGSVHDITAQQSKAAALANVRVDMTVQDAAAWAPPGQNGHAHVVGAGQTNAPGPMAIIDATATQVGPVLLARSWQVGPKLILVKGFLEGAVFPLQPAGGRRHWVIGRSMDSDVALSYDPYISRVGAEVRQVGETFCIRDLAPQKNGTYINGRRLDTDEAATLEDGDIVAIGRSLLVFRSR